MTAIDQAVQPFDANDPTTYNNATSATVFDSLGNSHVMQTFFVKIHPLPADPAGTQAQWDVYAAVDGTLLPAPAGGKISSLTFKSDGTIDTTATTLPITGIALPVTVPVQPLRSAVPALLWISKAPRNTGPLSASLH